MFLFNKIFGTRVSFIIGLLFLLVGCEKDISDKVKTVVQPKLAIFSFLSPQDTVLTVQVYKTKPILGFSPVFDSVGIRDATVILATGNQSVPLAYKRRDRNQRAYYGIDATALPIVAGKTYTLTVTTPDGLRATGVCTIPRTDGITITDLVHSETEKSQEWSSGQTYLEHSFNYKFQDAPGSDTYYRTEANYEYSDNQNGGRLERRPMNFDDRKSFLTDERKDGLLLISPIATFNTYENDRFIRPLTLFALLSVTDRSYYLYHQSLDRQSDSEDNPFAEPAIIYTNIQGGLGVFSGYNQLTATKQLE